MKIKTLKNRTLNVNGFDQALNAMWYKFLDLKTIKKIFVEFGVELIEETPETFRNAFMELEKKYHPEKSVEQLEDSFDSNPVSAAEAAMEEMISGHDDPSLYRISARKHSSKDVFLTGDRMICKLENGWTYIGGGR